MKNKHTFYMTLGCGQPYYPGYFTCTANDELEARELTSVALNNRWCGTYETLNQVHELDRICRGHIDEAGVHLNESSEILNIYLKENLTKL